MTGVVWGTVLGFGCVSAMDWSLAAETVGLPTTDISAVDAVGDPISVGAAEGIF